MPQGSSLPRVSAHRYTQVSARHRRSGRDAGTQAQGGETSYYSSICRAAKYRPWCWIPASMPVWRLWNTLMYKDVGTQSAPLQRRGNAL